MITAENGADTLNRNLFLHQRFAFARQRFDRTIASLVLPRLHIPITKNAVARSHSVGHDNRMTFMQTGLNQDVIV